MRTRLLPAVGALLAATCGACGGYDTPTAPTGTGVSQATITITAAGAAPSSVTITSGNRVTFVNNDTVAHDMSSDPHPTHGDCPNLTAGPVQPGQSRDSGTLTTRRTCGFHDHNDPDNAALRGTVTVQ